jgi:DNA primase
MSPKSIDVELVKNSTDLVSVVQQYVQLKRSGSSWKGLCPFHKEKTPSFYVSPVRGSWKCFGCGRGGDVISFLMEMRNLSFLEVLEELAEASGITFDRSGMERASTGASRGLYGVIAEAQKYYRKCFDGPQGKQARNYLEEREFSGNIAGVEIGYAPGGNTLLEYLRTRGFSVSVMADAGLVITDRGEPYDRFRKRITFPIRDRRGRVVSFGARGFGDAVPKYLNGPETAVYRKGSFLYGYSNAQKGARESGNAILVEGYFDHARLVSSGFTQTVATSGTALTEKQARNLRGMADNIFVCYDGDSAGSKAAVRAAEVLLAQGAYPLLVKLPEGEDPDDFIRKKGSEAFNQLLSSACDPVTFCVSLAGGRVPEGPARIKFAQRLLEVAVASSNPLVEEELQRKVEKVTGYSRTALSRTANTIRDSKVFSMPVRNKDEMGSGDRSILKAVTAGGFLDRELIRFLRNDDFTSEISVKIITAFREQLEKGYSSVVYGELPGDILHECVDITGAIEFVTSGEIDKLRRDIERKRREIPRLRGLQKSLSSSDPETKAIALEELADGRVLHER